MADKIYPTLPSAPPDGGLERYNRVRAIRNKLQTLKGSRYSCYKKYGKATSVLQNTATVLGSLAVAESTAGLVTSLTVIGLPVGVVLTALGVGSGFLAVLLTPITKHCSKKKLQHSKKHSKLSAGICMLDKKISSALNDNNIKDEEFDVIVEQYNDILDSLETFDVEKYKAKVKKELTDELLQSLPR